MAVDPQFALLRNLHDAGCDEDTTKKIVVLHAKGNIKDVLHLLCKHRRALLNEIHKNQKNIDCLDFLTFKLEQETILPNTQRVPK